MTTKSFKIHCLPLTTVKKNILQLWVQEYADIYNYSAKFIPSLPIKYIDEPNPSLLYTKWITSKLLVRNFIPSQSAGQAITDARANFKTNKIINVINMPNIIKFGNNGYIFTKKNNTYGIVLKGIKSKIFIPLQIGDLQTELRLKLDTASETKKDVGIILYNLRDNSISIPHKTKSSHKFLKKNKLETIIGVDRGINNHVVLSAIDKKSKKVLGIKIISGLESKDKMRHLKKIVAKRQESGKDVNNRIQNIQTTNAHRISHAIVEFALKYPAPIVIFEDLNSMKKQRLRQKNGGKASKGLRKTVASWNYADVKTKTDYKLAEQGLYSFEVKAWLTSQLCHRCGAIGIREGIGFKCPSCGLGVGSNPTSTIGQYNADVNASINIALRGLHVLYGRVKDTVVVSNGQPHETISNPIPMEMTDSRRYDNESNRLNETTASEDANRSSSTVSDQPMANVSQANCVPENDILSSSYKGVDNYPIRTESEQKSDISEMLS